MKKFGTNIMTKGKMKSHYTWAQLAEAVQEPPDWLRIYCNKQLKKSFQEHNGKDFNVEKE
jgi:hypothetical protein